jgi:hypothetical protein
MSRAQYHVYLLISIDHAATADILHMTWVSFSIITYLSHLVAVMPQMARPFFPSLIPNFPLEPLTPSLCRPP